MDITERKITKIAREAEKLVLRTMWETGVGTAEIDLIHALRPIPAAPRRRWRSCCTRTKPPSPAEQKNLEAKGYLVRRDAPNDRRSRCCTPTEKAENLKSSKAEIKRPFTNTCHTGYARKGSRRLCRRAEQALRGIQGGKPGGLPHFIQAAKGKTGDET